MTDQDRSIARRDVIMTVGLGVGAGLAAGLVPAAATAQTAAALWHVTRSFLDLPDAAAT